MLNGWALAYRKYSTDYVGQEQAAKAARRGNQGRYDAAEPLYERSLVIFEKSLRPGHPFMATALNNLALLYSAQGRYEEAEPLYEKALLIYETRP